MDMKKVKSSNVEAVGYDADKKRVAIKFHGNDKPYHYEGVSAADHKALVSAESVGGHLRSHFLKKYKAS